MSMKLPTQEELQAAQNERSQPEEASQALQENFSPISLGDWLNLCRSAEVPHVPATQIAQVLQDDYLHFETEGEHRTRLKQVWKAIQYARTENHMMRLDCCTDAELKYRMSRGDGGEFQPEFGGIMLDDTRSYNIVSEYPRENIPIWQRPWAKTQVIDGYPVEYRAYVPGRQAAGHQQLLPPAAAAPVPGTPEGGAKLH